MTHLCKGPELAKLVYGVGGQESGYAWVEGRMSKKWKRHEEASAKCLGLFFFFNLSSVHGYSFRENGKSFEMHTCDLCTLCTNILLL